MYLKLWHAHHEKWENNYGIATRDTESSFYHRVLYYHGKT